MNNVELVAQGYQYFAESNIPALLGLFDPEIVWDECSGFPYVEGDGIFTGPEAVVAGVFAMLPEAFDDFKVNVKELFGSGDKVVMVGHYEGKWKATGKSYHANATHVWTVKNGKITSYFQAVDTAEIISP